MNVFITRLIPEKALTMIAAVCTVDTWQGDDPPPYDQLIERVRGIDGLLCMLTDQIDGGVFAAAGSSLKVVSQMAVGYDNIDIAAAHARGVVVGNTPGVLTEATADLTLTLLLAAARRIPESAAAIRDGKWITWRPMELLGRDLAGATLGIVGFGRIGQAVAARARGFGMNMLAYSPSLTDDNAAMFGAQKRELDDVLAESDFVSLHLPLNAHTRRLMNAEKFALMKRDAILINTARGGVVDQPALLEALQNGVIGGAALDVTDPEPMPPDHALLSLPNVLIVPHIGSATYKTREKMAVMAAENLIAGIGGEPLPNPIRANP